MPTRKPNPVTRTRKRTGWGIRLAEGKYHGYGLAPDLHPSRAKAQRHSGLLKGGNLIPKSAGVRRLTVIERVTVTVEGK